MRISGSVALVTGASSGIGRATALALAAEGANVIVHGRDRPALEALAARLDGHALVADLGVAGEAEKLGQAALDRSGRVDILVANAGAGWAGPFEEMTEADTERLLAVNLAAPIALTRALLPGMRERGAGYLAYVTSIAGRTGVAGEAVYAATKAGLDGFAESLRLEVRSTGVEVGVLVPGVVDTRFFERRGRPYGRQRPAPIDPGPVGRDLVRLIATGGAELYRPGWLRLPVAVRGTLPGAYRALASRFGGS
ncbi:short-subunit dehydrogenase [Asanoa ferruginea]|uniref:Short-subunit dehydrogenase n=1 Tax=Asanoa ferruginea TaxID=53367 RepID=A0A3D9ZE88_9ACTN|nr:SDR family NAD(P)-dependent oxidoreductase [Asanoa ferruginea]REF94153.1 short-subunit dehydrogenase [Asanoa ferruginea]GIF52619.1 oxidoreductase [Asanoa ferruginea]